MINIAFKKILSFRKPSSTINALHRILPRGKFKDLLLTTPDRRECISSAAKILSLEESILLEKLSEILEIPILYRLQPLSGLQRTISPKRYQLLQAGAFPLCGNEQVVGVACIDPSLVKAVIPDFQNLPLFLSSWNAIKSAIESTDWESLSVPEQSQYENIQDDLGITVLEGVFAEARRYGRTQFEVIIQPEVGYRISISDSKIAQGKIHQRAKVPLFNLLKKQYFSEQPLGIFKNNAPKELRITQKLEGTVFLCELVVQKRLSENAILQPEERSKVVALPLLDERQGNGATITTESRVLLVDDNPTFARVLEKFLAKQGISTIYSGDGAQAIGVLECFQVPPSLIVCDIHMPVMNGFEFVRTIKEKPHLKSIPIIMLTSDEDIEAQIMLLSYGVEAFIGKNEDPRILCMHVKRIIEKEHSKMAA